MAIERNRFKRSEPVQPTRRLQQTISTQRQVPQVPVPQPTQQAVPIPPEQPAAGTNDSASLVTRVRSYAASLTSLAARLRPRRWPLNRRHSLIAAGVAVVLVGGLGYQLLRPGPAVKVAATASAAGGNLQVVKSAPTAGSLFSESSSPSSSPAAAASQPSKTLNFTPVVPAGEPQLAKVGKYDSTHGTYTFSDLFLAEPLEVTEQQLPGSYNAATAVSEAAGSYKLTTAFTTNSGTAYMGAVGDNQTAVFSTKGLLVFVQSTYTHSPSDWATYLDSLQ